MKMNKIAMALMVATLGMVGGAAHAESSITTGVGALSTSAKLDFEVVIPKFISLRVGTGVVMTTDATVNKLTATVPAASVGDGTDVAFTGSPVVVAIRGNGGDVALTASTIGALGNGSGDSIPFSEVLETTAGSIPAINLPASGASAATTVAATGKVVNLTDSWSFNYDNSAVYPAGTYGGTNTQNSRVTYTASVM